MENTRHIAELLKKRLQQTLTPAEEAELHAWAGSDNAYQALLEQVNDGQSLQQSLLVRYQLEQHDKQDYDEKLSGEVAARIAGEVGSVSFKKSGLDRWFPQTIKRWSYAAAVLIAATAATWFFFGDAIVNRPPAGRQVNQKSEDVAPGTNRATLTLADGRTVNLSEAQRGVVVGAEDIIYRDGTQLVVANNSDHRSLTTNHQLTTPKGGTYQITLVDGTTVWLNAASALTYPNVFAGDERVVELEGEGYFEVQKDKNRPFKVISKGQELEVLGTAFNISAYADEPTTKTTLVEGSVRVAPATDLPEAAILRAGQQSTLHNTGIDINKVNVAPYVAWKDGLFYFDNTPFDVMMRQIARWYDVPVSYKNGVPSDRFSGKLRRNVTLKGVLELLQASDIDIKLEGGTIVVH